MSDVKNARSFYCHLSLWLPLTSSFLLEYSSEYFDEYSSTRSSPIYNEYISYCYYQVNFQMIPIWLSELMKNLASLTFFIRFHDES